MGVITKKEMVELLADKDNLIKEAHHTIGTIKREKDQLNERIIELKKNNDILIRKVGELILELESER